MRTTFEIVTNSFANGYTRICFHPLPHVAYRPKAILSTDSPIVSAQEYDVHDLSAQRSSLASLPVLWLMSRKLYWSVVYCRKCLQYSILPQFIRGYIQVHFDRVNYAYSLDILVCGTKVGVTWRFVSRERWRRSAGRSASDPYAADVVRCLNAPTSLDIRNIASGDVLTSLVTDYVVTCQIGKLL